MKAATPSPPARIQIGIDSFAAASAAGTTGVATDDVTSMAQLLERVQRADRAGVDIFSIGEHHRREYLDSAPHVILGAAAATTERIRLGSAVTVLSAADPVRVYQNFATVDLISGGRVELVVGRGSFTESFPLFGRRLQDYDELFRESLDLLLELNEAEHVTWSGKFRPALTGQGVYPRPMQPKLPIWVGVGGTPESFARAGMLGLPLMVAIIGGETHRFRPLVDLYREAGRRAGHDPARLQVGVHSLGYVAPTHEEATRDFFPGYQRVFTKIGRERGWGPITRAHYEQQISERGALVVGDPAEVAAKILRHGEALGGITRFAFNMDMAEVPQEKLLRAIDLLGSEVRAGVAQGSAKAHDVLRK